MPDIILLDVNMPIMNGWEFLQAYKSIQHSMPKDIQIFLVTSSVDDADFRYAQQFTTVQDYIVKPISKDRMSELLQRVVTVG